MKYKKGDCFVKEAYPDVYYTIYDTYEDPIYGIHEHLIEMTCGISSMKTRLLDEFMDKMGLVYAGNIHKDGIEKAQSKLNKISRMLKIVQNAKNKQS